MIAISAGGEYTVGLKKQSVQQVAIEIPDFLKPKKRNPNHS